MASEEKVVFLYQDLVTICAKGRFQLTKWISNRRDVLVTIPESYRAKDMKRFNMDQDLLRIERVLGMKWCFQSDIFRFKVEIDQDQDCLRIDHLLEEEFSLSFAPSTIHLVY